MRSAFTLFLAAVIACSGPAAGQTKEHIWKSGNVFLSTCAIDADKTTGELTMAQLSATSDCIPYLRGLDDGARLVGAPYCAPDSVTNGQSEEIVVKFIRDHPERAHLSTGTLFLAAMEKAFPCHHKK
jgi:hypothetical protein